METPSSTTASSKKPSVIVLSAIVLIVLAAGGYMVLHKSSLGSTAPAQDRQKVASTLVRTVPTGKLADPALQEFVFVNGTTITDSSVQETFYKGATSTVSVAHFTIHKPNITLFKIYRDYLEKAGYKILSTHTEDKELTLFASKSPDKAAGQTVTISAVEIDPTISQVGVFITHTPKP